MVYHKIFNTFFWLITRVLYYSFVLICVSFFALFIRLQISPVDITSLTKKIPLFESMESGKVVLKWRSLSYNPRLEFKSVSLEQPAFKVETSAVVSVSLPSLFLGQLTLADTVLNRPTIQLKQWPTDQKNGDPISVFEAVKKVQQILNFDPLSTFSKLKINNGALTFPDGLVKTDQITDLNLSYKKAKDKLSVRFLVADQQALIEVVGDAESEGQRLHMEFANVNKMIPELVAEQSFLKPGLFAGQTKTVIDGQLQEKNNTYHVSLLAKHTTNVDKQTHTYQGSIESQISEKQAPFQGQIKISDISLDQLGDIWPEEVATNAHKWLTKNLSTGFLNNGQVWLKGHLSANIEAPVTVDQVNGHLSLDQATINYLDGMPKIVGARATAFFNETGFDIAIHHGRIRETLIKLGHMKITAMMSDRPMADLYVKLTSPLKSLLEIINTEPLALLKKYEFDIDHAEGAVVATLKMKFPLLKDVEFKDFDLDVDAKLTKSYLKKLTPQHPFVLSDGTYDLRIKDDQMTMQGNTLLNGLPADFTWHSYFYPKRTFKNHYQFKATASLNQIPEVDLSAYSEYLPGLIGFDVSIKELVNSEVNISVKANLDQTTVMLPVLGTIKKDNDPGFLYSHLIFRKGQLQHISELKYADDSGEIELEGHFKSNQDFKIDVSDVSVLKNKFNGVVISSPKDGLTVHIKGPFVDLSDYAQAVNAEVEEADKAKESKDGFKLPEKITLALGFEKVFLAENIVLEKFSATLNAENNILMFGRVEGDFYSKYPFIWKLDNKDGKQTLDFQTNNLGLLIRGFGLSKEIYGGRIDLKGTRDLPGPMKTKIKIENMTMKNIPAVVRILSLASISGLTQIFQGPGYEFSDGFIDCNYENKRLYITDSLLNGSGIAISAAGYIDFGKDKLNLTGQVVPFRSINQFLGAIPLIGTVLSGGTPDHGIFSFSYSAKGPLNNLDISSNPLSIFTPQTIKGLMREDESKKEEEPVIVGGVKQNYSE